MDFYDELQITAKTQMELVREYILTILRLYYDKPFNLECRVKSSDKLKLKQLLRENKYDSPELFEIPDIIGFRISVESEEEVPILSELIEKLLMPYRIVDYFDKPKSTGFKAKLYYFNNMGLNTEIQVMTAEMARWTEETHEEHNERKYGSLR